MPMLGMTLGRRKPKDGDDEELIYVQIVTCPEMRDVNDIPMKEWQVEIEQSKTLLDLKNQVTLEYGIEPGLQRLCTTSNRTDPGIKDTDHIADLASDTERTEVKRIFMLPKKGKEKEFLDGILAWAFENELLEDYTEKGCVYNPEGGVGPRLSMASNASGMRASLSSGMAKMRKPPRPSGAKIEINGDKVEMTDMPSPITERLAFNVICFFIAAGNVLVVGLEADYTCWGLDPCTPADRMGWYALDVLFTLLFMLELGARILILGPCDYFCGDSLTTLSGISSTANIIDFVVVFLRFLDTAILDNVGVDSKIKILSCVRIMNFARVARLMRLVRSVRELWLIVAGLADLLKTILWVMILLVCIFWIVGILTTIFIGHSDDFFDYSRSDFSKSEYFDTVPKSVFSLFQVMTLSQWSTIMVRPVVENGPAILIIFVPFLMLTTVGLLNIIVGVVVETTLTSAANNGEKEAKEMQKVHAQVMESLKNVFEEADTDGGGTLDKHELHKSLKKPHVRDRLKVLDIPVKDLDGLFDVLDIDRTGEVSTDQFFRGCARLRGLALACDLHRMSVDFSRYIQWSDDLVLTTRSTNDRLRSLLHDMESVDRDIIKGESDEFDPVLEQRRDRSFKIEQKEKTREQGREVRKVTKETQGSKGSRRPSLMSRTCTQGQLMG